MMLFDLQQSEALMRGYTPRVADMNEVPTWLARVRELVGEDHGRISEVARVADMPRQQVQQIVNGKNLNPTVGTLTKIAKACGNTLDDLFAHPEGGEGNERRAEVGSMLLDRAIREAKRASGTWQSDVADALSALARALSRDSDQPKDSAGSPDARR